MLAPREQPTLPESSSVPCLSFRAVLAQTRSVCYIYTLIAHFVCPACFLCIPHATLDSVKCLASLNYGRWLRCSLLQARVLLSARLPNGRWDAKHWREFNNPWNESLGFLVNWTNQRLWLWVSQVHEHEHDTEEEAEYLHRFIAREFMSFTGVLSQPGLLDPIKSEYDDVGRMAGSISVIFVNEN